MRSKTAGGVPTVGDDSATVRTTKTISPTMDVAPGNVARAMGGRHVTRVAWITPVELLILISAILFCECVQTIIIIIYLWTR